MAHFQAWFAFEHEKLLLSSGPWFHAGMLPCVIHEDEHLLVVNKPAGMNTHAPGPFAGEGIYDWLRSRESRWSSLSILHRLDKQTSGVMVFGKTPAANRSLTRQFTAHKVRKRYLLRTDRPVPQESFTVRTALVRAGEKYLCRPPHRGAEVAETRFKVLPAEDAKQPCRLVEAIPITGRTHQIRAHAAERGFPVLGDTLYGGTPSARVSLHAAEISFRHPATDQAVTFHAPLDFDADPRAALRLALIEPEATNAFRLIHGSSDGWPGWYVDRLGEYLLSQSAEALGQPQTAELARLIHSFQARGAYHKVLMRQVRRATLREAAPQLVIGEPAPDRFVVNENSVRFELSFNEGYSVGLFLDQRDNRRRFLVKHVAEGFSLFDPKPPSEGFEVLNTFAYTCAFSVCAALAGARVTSLDLSKKYLEWGKRNFAFNNLNPASHDFIYGDAFDWMRRLGRKGRQFDVVVLDPPTFSQSKQRGVFRVEKDYADLVKVALPLVKSGGVILASTNAADWPPEKSMAAVKGAVSAVRRKIACERYFPQPPDFPISQGEPAYLKTLWLRIA